MAPIIGLAVVIVLCFVLFPKEIAKRDLNPLVLFLLVIALVLLTQHRGKTIELGPALWGSYWLPQMLGIIILFLLYIIPGPKLMTILKEKGPAAYQALTRTVISILLCVLIGLVTMTVSSSVVFR
jgi:hypothetical protein